MNYELAKELKEAGFPQQDMPQFDAEGYIHRTLEEEENWVYEPTLEELIEACGSDFGGLLSTEKGFVAHARIDALGNGAAHEGSIPSEAVARLWLALNKK